MIAAVSVESHRQIRSRQIDIQRETNSQKAAMEQQLMALEDSLSQEQANYRAALKSKVEPLETEIRQLKDQESSTQNKLRDRISEVTQLETKLAVERDLQAQQREEIDLIQA